MLWRLPSSPRLFRKVDPELRGAPSSIRSRMDIDVQTTDEDSDDNDDDEFITTANAVEIRI